MFLLFFGIAYQGAQFTGVGLRKIGHKLGNRAIVCQQSGTRLLDALQKGIVCCIVAAQFGQIGFDGRGVGIAHQAADKLGLAFERAVGRDFFIGGDGLEQLFVQADFFQRIAGELGQFHTQSLQIVHLLFHLGFADPFVFLFKHCVSLIF